MRSDDPPSASPTKLLLVYWGLFSVVLIGASLEQLIGWRSTRALWFVALLMTVLIGLRFHVGADWLRYYAIFAETGRKSLLGATAVTGSDPAYSVLNWGVNWLGADVWLVNLVCGAIFSIGLIRFAQVQERPWLTVLVAVPYLVIVVAMGLTRQAVAIGIILGGLSTYLRKGGILSLAGYILVASLFHKTAVVALPLIAVSSGRRRVIGLLLAPIATVYLYRLLLYHSIAKLIRDYIDVGYSSEGASVRVAMIVLPAAIFFLNRRRMNFNPIELSVWRNFSVAAFALLALLWISPSSTVVDRFALYVIPIQLAILPRAGGGLISPALRFSLVVLYSALVQFAWLTFAVFAKYWVPYHFWPLDW